MATYCVHSGVAAAALAGIEVGGREAANKETRRIIQYLRDEADKVEAEADKTRSIIALASAGSLRRAADQLETALIANLEHVIRTNRENKP